MKKFLFLAAFAASLLCACNRVEIPVEEPEIPEETPASALAVPHSIHVDVSDADTKALITPKTGGGYTFEWTGDEQIVIVEALYDANGRMITSANGVQFYPYEGSDDYEEEEQGEWGDPIIILNNGKASFEATFSYEDEFDFSTVATVKYFGAVYVLNPYNWNRPYCMLGGYEEDDYCEFSLRIPSQQTVRPDSFDPSADMLVSETLTYQYSPDNLPTSFSMKFARLGSILKMTLTGLEPGTKVYDVRLMMYGQNEIEGDEEYEYGMESFPAGNIYYDPLNRLFRLEEWGEENIYISFYDDSPESESDDDDYGYVEPPCGTVNAQGKLDLWLRTLPCTVNEFTVELGEDRPCEDPDGHAFSAYKAVKNITLDIPSEKLVTMSVNMGSSITYRPEVRFTAPEGMECEDGTYIGYVGRSYKFDAEVLYPEDWDGTLEWSTWDTSYLSVDQDGTITIKRMPEYSPYVSVSVYDAETSMYMGSVYIEIRRIVATSLSITTRHKTMGIGESWTIDFVIEPADAVVSWSVDNYWVASVSNGVLTANSAGTATVTAKSGSLSATCEITVVDEAIMPSGPVFNAAAAQVIGNLLSIGKVVFEYKSSNTGTRINEGLGIVPIYMRKGNEYMWESGIQKEYTVLYVSTPASKFIADEDCSQMFKGISNATRWNGLSYLDTSNATDMSEMFSGCTMIGYGGWTDPRYLVNSFKTSNVTDMHEMFAGCSEMGTLGLDGTYFNTSNVTDMSGMFKNCAALRTIYFGDNFKTDNVTTMKEMFYNCRHLKPSLSPTSKFSSWNVSKVENMHEMFYQCGYDYEYYSYGENDFLLGGWDTGKVQDMGGMFSNCINADIIDLSGWNTSSVVFMNNMFERCQHVTSIRTGSNWTTTSVLDMSEMFLYCRWLTSLDLSSFNLSGVMDLTGMFNGCTSLSSLSIGSAHPWPATAYRGNMFGSNNQNMIGYDNRSNPPYTTITCFSEVWSAISTLLGSNVSNYAFIALDSDAPGGIEDPIEEPLFP